MNKKTKNDAQARERALQLVHSLVDEKIDPQLHAQLFAWFMALDEGSVGEEAFAGFALGAMRPNRNPDRREFEQFRQLQRRLGMEVDREPPVKLKIVPRRRFVWRAAAVLIPFFVIASAVWFGQDRHLVRDIPELAGAENQTVIEAFEGVQKDVRLPDSTRVWVNSGTKLTFGERFADARSVTLEGEAYFDVRPDAKRPFVVRTEHIDVRVLGTRFDVTAFPGSGMAEVELFEGSVEVLRGAKTLRVLVPGERLVYLQRTGQFTVTAQDHATDWRSEVVYATDRTLPELFRMIGNYYDVTIEFDADDFPEGELFTTAFGKANTVDKVLGSIGMSSGQMFTYAMAGDTIKIERTKR